MSAEFLTDMDGYPAGQTLTAIEDWPYDDMKGLVQFVAPYFQSHGAVRDGNEEGVDENLTALATGGWSGCEMIIGAMKSNQILWSLHWFSSRRGGLHKFVT
jgi:hypothetical protein